MPGKDTSASIAALVALVGELVRDKGQALRQQAAPNDDSTDETHRLLTAFSNGEISSEQIVNELSARYQTGVGAVVQALAEFDKNAAQQLGERLRLRLDSALAEIASRGSGPKQVPGKLAEAPTQQSGMPTFKDRSDVVLLREYALVSALSSSDQDAKAADLIRAAKAFEPEVTAEAVTAHLLRLVNAGVLGRERKGRYHGTADSRRHFQDLTNEIEARRLRLPPKTVIAE
ncbi:MAG: hypothetical protein ABL907_08370 [Hyphomicrobium sp.]